VICPFLGTPGDFSTSLAFPSKRNHCHRSKPVAGISLDHQKNCCLAGNYERCPAYLQPLNRVLPPDLRNVKPARSFKTNTIWKLAFVIPVLLLIFGWNFLAHGDSFSILLFLETPSPITPALSVLPTLLPVGTSTSMEQYLTSVSPATFTPPPLPSPSSTFSNAFGSRVTPIITRRPHGMEDLIGTTYIFKIHRVRQGWDIEKLASYYNTTVAAMMAVNYQIITPLYPGQVVIIPVNQLDASGLPQFEIYQVAENITIEKMAVQLNVDPDQLRYFNRLETSDELMAREWIIVPREKKSNQ
jgi:hypothetical protein